MQPCDISHSTIRNFEPTAIHNSGSVPVTTEGYEDVRLKQCATIEFLTVEKFLPPTFMPCSGCMGINVSM